MNIFAHLAYILLVYCSCFQLKLYRITFLDIGIIECVLITEPVSLAGLEWDRDSDVIEVTPRNSVEAGK